jgi:hypothetical protein
MMTTFCIVRENESRRVFLEEETKLPERGHTVLDSFEADSWKDAREMITVSQYTHRPSYGYFDE